MVWERLPEERPVVVRPEHLWPPYVQRREHKAGPAGPACLHIIQWLPIPPYLHGSSLFIECFHVPHAGQ